MLAYLGLQSVPTEMLFFGVIMAFAASVIFGWTTDLAMKDRGFGPLGNALVGVVGAILGPRIWFLGLGHGSSLLGADPASLLTCGAASALSLLLLSVLLKKALASA